MDLTTCYIDATITRDSTNPTFPPPPDRPWLPFLSFLEFPYLLSFLSVAASLGPQRNSSPLFPITCRLFSQKHGGVFVHFSNFALRFSARLIFQFRFSNPAFSSLVLPSSAPSCTPPSVHFRISRFQFRASV